MPPEENADVVVAILAAGLATRMQGRNKLLEPIGGRSLVRQVAEAAKHSLASGVVVVLGHEADRVRGALAGLDLDFAYNRDYADGMASSIRTAVRSLGSKVSGVIFCLGDMPRVTTEAIDALIGAHRESPDCLAFQPAFGGRRGNPVLWAGRAFPELLSLSGAEGARPLLQRHRDQVREVPVNCPGILLDIDTPEDLAALAAAPPT